MTIRMLALLLFLVLTGCTRVIDSPRPTVAPVAPITAGQVGDLLSQRAKPDPDSNLFATVEPVDCAGLAREVDPPFIFATTPAAHDGGQSFAQNDPSVSIQEIVAVYRADFDAAAKVDEIRHIVESCRNGPVTATAMQGEVVTFHPLPPRDSGSPEIVLWSMTGSWACDNAFVAAHNAAIELTACGQAGGFDVLPLARDAVKRIETLANTSA